MSERIKAGYRVDSDLLDSFKDAIRKKYGKLRPYAGVILENELRAVVDDGDIATVRDAVDDLADSLPADIEREKNSEGMQATGDRRKCQLRLSKQVKEDLREFSNEQGASVRSIGRLVDRVMCTYVTEGSSLEQVADRVEACTEAVESLRDMDDLDAVQRRVRILTEALSDTAFTIDDFNEVVDEQLPGISATYHARQKYLPDVLEEKGMTWHPEKGDLYVDPDAPGYDIPEIRDPRGMPKLLRDEEDEELAIMCEVYEADMTSSIRGTISKSDAAELIRSSHQRAASMMQEIGEKPGYDYVPSHKVLACHSQEVYSFDVLDVVEEGNRNESLDDLMESEVA